MIARLIRVRDKLHVAGISSQDSTRIAVAMLPGLPQLN
jgi:hypothetical protein